MSTRTDLLACLRLSFLLVPASFSLAPLPASQVPAAPARAPRTWASVDGRYQLEQLDTEPSSAQPASQCLRDLSEGKVVWSGGAGVHLDDAVVSNSGSTFGYSYSTGVAGRKPDSGAESRGSLTVIVLDERGDRRQALSILRQERGIPHALPYPTVTRVMVSNPGQIGFLCMDENRLGSNGPSIWAFDLASGEFLSAFHPTMSGGHSELQSSISFDPIANSPLIATAYWGVDPSDRSQGSGGDLVLSVFDVHGRLVWREVTRRGALVAWGLTLNARPTLHVRGGAREFGVSVGVRSERLFHCWPVGDDGAWKVSEFAWR